MTEELEAMLRNVAKQNKQLVRRTKCPNDATPLEKHPKTGILHCKFCGWTEDGQLFGNTEPIDL